MKRGLKFLLFSDAWVTLALGMIGPIYAIFVEEIGGDILDASWAFFAFMISCGIALYIIGKWEDKVKHKEKLITAGYTLTAIGCLCYYFVDSQAMLIMTQIILGLAEAIQVPAYDALYSKYLEKKKAASQWADWEAMQYIVTAIAAVVGGYLATIYGFKVLFLVMFMISGISIASSLNMFRSKKELESN